MKLDQSRSDLIIGSVLVTIAFALQQVTHWPLWVFVMFLVSGIYLWGEAARTHHVFQTAICFERTAMAQAKAPQLKQPPIVRTVPNNLRDLIYDWSEGKPTTKEHAINVRKVTQGQWQAAVSWAVRHDLGVLVPAQGGSEKLRWTAQSLNDFLPLMDGLAN